MKKIFSTIVLLFAINFCYSQAAISIPFVGVDSLINADTVVKNITLSSSLNGVIFQPVITRASGTAAGKVVFAQSIDGVNYIPTDSITLTNILTNSTLVSKSTPVSTNWRITFISSGTTALWPQLWYLPRKDK
jgi:hypothetical protein